MNVKLNTQDLEDSKPTMDKTREAAQSQCLAVVREVVRAYQAFSDFSSGDIKHRGLSNAEFDVICTLGNQPGMTFKEIGENTLITKTTLTGVVDRLESKGYVERKACPDDRRCVRAMLTDKGDELFRDVFPAHVAQLDKRIDDMPEAERKQVIASLAKLRQLLGS
ncbi:MAG: MarR family transcriptional regulator [Gammaproteobacteria bacterium]|nr:MarR family transcriptional regulator [Gammaproteobacteria bacterium]